MKLLNKFLMSGLLSLAISVPVYAECDIDISIANITKGEVVPEAINRKLDAKLTQAMGKAGLTVAPYDSRFFLAGRFDDAFKDVTAGPSQQVYVKTTLTLYIGDATDQKIFASESFEISGVGGSEQLAYTRALNKINAANKQLQDFINNGKQKIIDYYDANYASILAKANQAVANRNFDEALFYTTEIPACSKGYNEALTLALSIEKQRMNHAADSYLAKAKAAWAADPTAAGASKAHEYLVLIDRESSSYAEAQQLSATISKATQKQWEFENVTKYNNQLDLEKQRIAAAKEAAVAWAKSRPKTVNRYYFVHRW